MMRSLPALVVAAGALAVAGACSDFDSEATGPAADAGATGSPNEFLDADTTLAPVVPTCSGKPFTAVSPVTGTIPSNARCFTLSPGEDRAFYLVDRTLYEVPFAGGVFGAPTAVSADKTDFFGCATFNTTGSVMLHEDFFRIFRQVRDVDSGAYGDPQEVPPTELPEGVGLLRPFFDTVRSDLYVSVVRTAEPLKPPYGIARAPLAGNGKLGTFAVVNVGDEGAHDPVVSRDSLALYFSSSTGTASGPDGGANDDIWVATRTSSLEPFATPVLVDGVNSPHLDAPRYLTKDGCTLYLESTRDTPGAGFRLFVATRTP